MIKTTKMYKKLNPKFNYLSKWNKLELYKGFVMLKNFIILTTSKNLSLI